MWPFVRVSEALGEQGKLILAKLWSCEQQASAAQSQVFLMILIGLNSVGQMHPETTGASVSFFNKLVFMSSPDTRMKH